MEKYSKLSNLQAGFRRNCRTADQILALDTIISNILSKKRGKLYAGFIDFQKAFDTINREALWFKLFQKGLSVRMIRILQSIYSKVLFCIKCADGNATECQTSKLGVKQGCILSPLLFILFIDDLVNELELAGVAAPRIGNAPIAGLLYADDLAMLSLTTAGLQNGFDRLQTYCNDWKMTVNVDKTKVMVFKKGHVFSREENWVYNGAIIEKVKKFNYLGITLAMNGKWSKHIEYAKLKSRKALGEIKMRLSIIPEIPVALAEKLYYSTVQATMSYGAEVWGLENIDHLRGIQTDFYKGLLGVARGTSNCGTLREVGCTSDVIECKMRAIKYWLNIVRRSDPNSLPFICLADQLDRPDDSTWAGKIQGALEAIGMRWVWSLGRDNTQGIWRSIREVMRDNERKETAAACREMQSLCIQNQTYTSWQRESYLNWCNVTQRSGLAWFRLGSWLQFRIKDNEGINVCPLCNDFEDYQHILFKCTYTKLQRKRCSYLDKIDNIDNNEIIVNMFQQRPEIVANIGDFLSEIRVIRTNRIYTIMS